MADQRRLPARANRVIVTASSGLIGPTATPPRTTLLPRGQVAVALASPAPLSGGIGTVAVRVTILGAPTATAPAPSSPRAASMARRMRRVVGSIGRGFCLIA